MRPGRYTADELVKLNCHYTGHHDPITRAEIWTKEDKVIHYNRTHQIVIKIVKIED